MLKIITTGLLLAITVILLTSCIQDGGTLGRPEVSVISENLTADTSGQALLKVLVKNTGPVKAELVEVAVKFYGAGNKLLDSKRDSIMNLNPGETWEFLISCNSTPNKIANWKTTTTTGASN
jgi:hypothetical protein